jgi:uncharacterized membrane protein YccF (DUF307 family)
MTTQIAPIGTTTAQPQVAIASLVERRSGPGFLIRAAWYLAFGWWLAGLGMAIAWIAGITIIGLPLAFWVVNHIPTLLTLRPRTSHHLLVVGADGVVHEQRIRTGQTSTLGRLVYFGLVGWWLSGLWMLASYALVLSLVGMPIGIAMVNRLPFVFSLHRGYA